MVSEGSDTSSSKKRGPSNSTPRPRGGSGSSDSSPPANLPPWFERLLEAYGGFSGCRWTYTSPFLSRYKESFRSCLGLGEVTCVHVTNFLCPVQLYQQKPKVILCYHVVFLALFYVLYMWRILVIMSWQRHRHSSNGVILVLENSEDDPQASATREVVLYSKCCYCRSVFF